MTPDEQKLLADLAAKIAQTPAPPRDPDAESFIRAHIGNRPDALYLMTQTVLIQGMALDQARQQIQQLQQQAANAGAMAPAPAGGGSFLGGGARPAAGPAPGPGYAQGGYGQGYAAAPPPPPIQYAPVQGQPAGSGPSFLRSAATTAAGVAGGMLAFEGISSLIGGMSHGFGGGSQGFLGGGGFGGGGFGGGETIIENNYYGSQGGGEERGYDARAQEDRSFDANDSQDQAGSDAGVDDGSSFDDGGGFDDGGSGGGDDLV